MAPESDPFGLSDPSFFGDPYPAYARMRDQGSPPFVETWGGWALVRYADVAAGFRDARLSARRSDTYTSKLPEPVRERLARFTNNVAAWALLMDAPMHTRVRALINKAFTPRVAEGLRPAVTEIAQGLVEEALARSEDGVDIVASLANPLPVMVIGDLLGLPREDRHRLKKWSDALAAAMGAPRPNLDVAVVACDAVVEMEAYFRDVLDERRRTPGDDLLSQLVMARDGGKLLDEQELLSTCTMLLFGGHETTTNLIAVGLLALIRHPEQMQRLRDIQGHEAAESWPRAIDELMRFDSPVQRMGRIASEDMDIAGSHVRAGNRVFLVMASANRDESVFPGADRLDVTRAEGRRHLGFGLGTHYCVGAALGRMEAEIALRELLRKAPRIDLAAGELRWHHNASIRGVESLRVHT
jgi:cytochrome P450